MNANVDAAKSSVEQHRWLVSFAVSDLRFHNGEPLTYGPDDDGVRERIRRHEGRAAIVEADSPTEAVDAAVEWLEAEYPDDLTCGECQATFVVNGVDVIDLDAVLAQGLLRHFEFEMAPVERAHGSAA